MGINLKKVNFLWLDSELGEVELLSLNSFVKKGYYCILWSYVEIKNTPSGVFLKDANEIIPFIESINKTRFSDYFRYKLLFKNGGIWSDIDNICIKNIPNSRYIFPSYMHSINNNFLKAPKGSKLMKSIIKDIEPVTISFSQSTYNLEYLYNKIVQLGLEEYQAQEDVYNPLKHYTTHQLGIKLFDWSEFNSVVIHLFKSSYRVSLVTSDLYRLNINNLKKIINE